MTDDLCEVAITAPDAEWLAGFVRGLVQDRLCASGHTLTPGRSTYRWAGEMVDRPEARATVRTRTSLVPRIIERLNQEHPYDVPGVVAMPIVATSDAYRAWLLDQTEPPA
jgi:periplasmic divalent cation tolerance protein